MKIGSIGLKFKNFALMGGGVSLSFLAKNILKLRFFMETNYIYLLTYIYAILRSLAAISKSLTEPVAYRYII